MKKIILAICLSCFLIGCNNNQNEKKEIVTIHKKQNEFKPYNVGDKIKIKSITNKEITLVRTENGFKIDGENKILMIDIFGTFCQPCKEEATNLTELQIKNNDNFMIIGFTHFENSDNHYVMENFAKKYNALYFISTSKEKERIIKQILKDIKYDTSLQIPFKVVLKNGIYQKLTNPYDNNAQNSLFYLGRIDTTIIQKDLDKIKNTQN